MKEIIVSVFILLILLTAKLYAEELPPTDCLKSDTKIQGVNRKYSMFADIDGFVSFNAIDCSIEWRNRELCAMEMIAFDTTSMVIDFVSGDEIEMNKAYFVINTDSIGSHQIVAFKNIADGDKYLEKNTGLKIVTYDELVDMQFTLQK